MKFLLIALLFANVPLSYAQELNDFNGEIKWDENWRSASAPEINSLSCVDKESAYFLNLGEAGIFIQKYALDNFSQLASSKVEGFGKKDKVGGLGLKRLNETLYLYGSIYDADKRARYDFVRIVDTESLAISEMQIISNEDKVKSASGKTAYEYHRWFGNFPTGHIFSGNKEIAFVTESANNKDIGTDPKGIIMIGRLIDSDLNITEEREYKIPYKNAWIEQVKVGNDGLVYILERGKKQRGGMLLKGYYEFGKLELVVLNMHTGEIKTTEIPEAEETKIFSSQLTIGEDGSIIISGILTKNKYDISSIIFTKFNNDLEQEISLTIPISNEFRTSFKGDDFDKPGESVDPKRQNYQFKVRDFIRLSNGTSTYLIEQHHFRVKNISHDPYKNIGGQTTVSYEYYYDDIIAINFSDNGEVNWQTVIEKRQRTENAYDPYVSFYHAQNNGELTLFYNESEYEQRTDKASLSKDEKKLLQDKNIGIKVNIDVDGSFTKEKIFAPELDAKKVFISNFLPSSKGEGVIVIKKLEKKGIGKREVSQMKFGVIEW
ncbi:MAG: hypothetical protein ACI8ZM_003382 [Crocinitomix sp.]|jgi:hypothetical protein